MYEKKNNTIIDLSAMVGKYCAYEFGTISRLQFWQAKG